MTAAAITTAASPAPAPISARRAPLALRVSPALRAPPRRRSDRRRRPSGARTGGYGAGAATAQTTSNDLISITASRGRYASLEPKCTECRPAVARIRLRQGVRRSMDHGDRAGMRKADDLSAGPEV